MNFKPPQSFRTEDPTLLDADLARLTDAAALALTQLERERAARWRVRRIRGATGVARFPCAMGEFLVINTEDAAVQVALPGLNPASVGREVAFARYDHANALTFIGSNGALVNGAASFTAAASVGRGPTFVNDGSAWWAVP